MLRLAIQTPYAIKTIDISPATQVGAFLSSFVRANNFPLVDIAGKPLLYQLRLSANEEIVLPLGESFASLGIAQGSLLLLEGMGTSDKTIPNINVRKRLYSRRLFLGLCATSGLGAGFFTALAQQISLTSGQQHVIPHLSPTAGNLAHLPTGALPLLTFSHHRQRVRSIDWSPDGKTLASGSDDTQVFIWDANGTVLQSLSHPASVRSLAWAPDSKRLATASANQVAFWAAQPGELLASSSRPHSGIVTCLAWSQQRPEYAVSGGQDNRCIVWNTNTLQAQGIFTRHTSPIESATFAPNGATIATSSSGGVIRIWDVANEQETHGYFFDAPTPLHSVSFSPISGHLICCGGDGLLREWADGGVCQSEILGNSGQQCADQPLRQTISQEPLRAAAWAKNGQLFAVGGDDGSVTVGISQQNLAPLFAFQHQNPITSLAWGPGNDLLAVASGTTVTIWQLR